MERVGDLKTNVGTVDEPNDGDLATQISELQAAVGTVADGDEDLADKATDLDKRVTALEGATGGGSAPVADSFYVNSEGITINASSQKCFASVPVAADQVIEVIA